MAARLEESQPGAGDLFATIWEADKPIQRLPETKY